MKAALLFPPIFWVLSFGSTCMCAALEPDQHADCERWADSGECDKRSNIEWMWKYCETSCDRVFKANLEANKELEGISSFFDLKALDIHGNMVNFSDFRGKVTIIVNVASYCGYTDAHYKGLVELWNKLKDEPANILAFPCNQFGAQEPNQEIDIERFAIKKGVEFRMMSKVKVNGPEASVVFKYLKQEANPPIESITWNFATYFIVSPDGWIASMSGVEPGMLYESAIALLPGHHETPLGDEL